MAVSAGAPALNAATLAHRGKTHHDTAGQRATCAPHPVLDKPSYSPSQSPAIVLETDPCRFLKP